MSYTIGQAVMITFNLETQMVFLYQETIGEYIKTSGLINSNDSATVLTVSTRPATEAEILAEAVKHGWKVFMENETICNCTHSPNYWFGLDKYSEWEIDGSDTYTPMKNTLKEYCEEGLIAHRLITALNLAK